MLKLINAPNILAVTSLTSGAPRRMILADYETLAVVGFFEYGASHTDFLVVPTGNRYVGGAIALDGIFVDMDKQQNTVVFISSGGEVEYINIHRIDVEKRSRIPPQYACVIKTLPYEFLACRNKCGLFYGRRVVWSIDVGDVIGKPSYCNGYWYIPDVENRQLIIVDDGKIVNRIQYKEPVIETSCIENSADGTNRLAVLTKHHLYVYEIYNPVQPILRFSRYIADDAQQLAIGGNKYIATVSKRFLRIYDTENGWPVHISKYGEELLSVSWHGSLLAVGSNNARIYFYEVMKPTDYPAFKYLSQLQLIIDSISEKKSSIATPIIQSYREIIEELWNLKQTIDKNEQLATTINKLQQLKMKYGSNNCDDFSDDELLELIEAVVAGDTISQLSTNIWAFGKNIRCAISKAIKEVDGGLEGLLRRRNDSRKGT